ncbi:hypothetical protein Taro_009397 [Colocasia esculenta]|uniref:Uncharacterized protein n=1 Tax=Colocasia esculenta TaxID=4460 RepID=A0A843U6A7_COLES|nr:hypothetical protein [Colocasia esculenta]
MLPHRANADVKLASYDVPKGSNVLVNVWAIARNPAVWKDPLEFRPERFSDEDVDMKGHDFRLLPFGAGRRMCPGAQLGINMVQSMLGHLFHQFRWERRSRVDLFIAYPSINPLCEEIVPPPQPVPDPKKFSRDTARPDWAGPIRFTHARTSTGELFPITRLAAIRSLSSKAASQQINSFIKGFGLRAPLSLPLSTSGLLLTLHRREERKQESAIGDLAAYTAFMEPGPGADSGGGEVPPASAAGEQEEEPSVGTAGGNGDGGGEEDEALLARAQKLLSKILAARANPNPKHLHALASMLETQERRYLQESGSSSSSNGRSSHLIGRLGNLIQDNDEFFDLVQSKFLSESRYSVIIHAAATRLIVSCSSTWVYPPVFEDSVLDNIKSWVMDDIAVIPGDESNWKDLGRNMSTDSEMLKAYSTGLLAISLAGGGQLVEDVLTSGLSARLMHYLRIRVLGEVNPGQKDATIPLESKHTSGASVRSRDERGRRSRPVLEAARSEVPRMGDEGLFGDQNTEREHDRSTISRLPEGEECWTDGPESLRSDLGDSPAEVSGVFPTVDKDVEQLDERWCGQDVFDGRSRSSYGPSRSARDEDADENVRDDLRRRMNRGVQRNRGTGKTNEGSLESEIALPSPGSGSRMVRGRSVKDRIFPKGGDIKTSSDTKNIMNKVDCDAFSDEHDAERFKECTIGTRDISDLVKKAIMAAEAEARVANAPPEAIKAAGDAAAELVKTSALEAWKSSNDEEAAVLAASKAASTVVDAAIATEMARQVPVSSDASEDPRSCETVEPEKDEEPEEFYILDDESLAQLREKYSIQCLEILGEYVEALGPVLHEKGVDVCLALLQRCFKSKGSPQSLVLLPEILKLICALAAHRKFAAVFVDRGGMQKLLSVERVTQTFSGLSSCLFTIGTLQGIMERVCALPSDVVNEVVELALQLLECPQDQARKNAAVFFAAAFVFRAVLDSFDAQEGLQKMLNLLHGTASVRSGGNSGTLNLPNAPLRNDRSPADVLTASEKQIAYHTCVASRQYFRAHLLLLVDSLRPNKSSRSLARHSSSARAAYKPLDISNEAMDAIFLQIQRDRKLGPAFVRARWPAVDNFLASNGHVIMLELCQAPPAERYLHDLAPYALGVLHIVTLVPYSRKMIVNATLSNDRVGMAVILDAINSAGGVDPEVIQPALNVLVNLVCPPPSISYKPPLPAQGQQSVVHGLNGPGAENREKNYERTFSDRITPLPVQSEPRERNGEANPVERGSTGALGTPFPASSSQTVVPSISSGVVGDRRISLGPGAGCAGLAAQLEQGYRQARESVRSNNGIKVLLHFLHPRMITPPATLDCLRALACRVLLGLARDETIAHILTKLQAIYKYDLCPAPST